jgi:phage portal protein BeeE
MMQGHLSLRGNAYARIIANGDGEVTDLLPIHPDAVKVEGLDNGSWRYRIKQATGADEVLPARTSFTFAACRPMASWGSTRLPRRAASIALGLAAQSYGERFFQNDGKPGGWIEHPGSSRTPTRKTISATRGSRRSRARTAARRRCSSSA